MDTFGLQSKITYLMDLGHLYAFGCLGLGFLKICLLYFFVYSFGTAPEGRATARVIHQLLLVRCTTSEQSKWRTAAFSVSFRSPGDCSGEEHGFLQ